MRSPPTKMHTQCDERNEVTTPDHSVSQRPVDVTMSHCAEKSAKKPTQTTTTKGVAQKRKTCFLRRPRYVILRGRPGRLPKKAAVPRECCRGAPQKFPWFNRRTRGSRSSERITIRGWPRRRRRTIESSSRRRRSQNTTHGIQQVGPR